VCIVVLELYKDWGDIGYLCCGLFLSLPPALLPNLFPSEADKKLHWTKRFVTKANIFIGLMNFAGNYFWTHYFFVCLGASYTFPVTWKLNGVPIAFFLITQSYFTTYYIISNLVLRRVNAWTSGTKRYIWIAAVVALLSWFFAFMETWTIESVPYYSFVDRGQMYKVGLTFYALYFVPSFPMFFMIDEEGNECWSLWDTICSGLASSMIVFYLVDFWRLIMGNITGADLSIVPFVHK